MKAKDKKREIICRCNNISRQTIEEAIANGCRTMNEIYDETQAGVGPCGGSCRRIIVPILKTFLETGTFEKPKNTALQAELSEKNTTEKILSENSTKKTSEDN